MVDNLAKNKAKLSLENKTIDTDIRIPKNTTKRHITVRLSNIFENWWKITYSNKPYYNNLKFLSNDRKWELALKRNEQILLSRLRLNKVNCNDYLNECNPQKFPNPSCRLCGLSNDSLDHYLWLFRV